jgi:phosphoglycerol transferase MdoB-like AlkP superfamily enzyme
MGFDEFIDIESFNKNDTFGPYIKDAAVTKKIIETLAKQDEPVFIFAITMENHGPLHLEKTTEEDIARLYDDTPPQPHNDLTVYLRHLKNADDTLGELVTELKQLSGEAILCLYGDHIPSMPDIYKATDYEDDQTDYFIWSNQGSANHELKELNAEQLAEYLVSSNTFST